MSYFDITETSVPIAAEDKYLIFAFGTGRSLCPHSNHAEHLGSMVWRLQSQFGQITPVFDLRGLEGYDDDIDMFIRSVGGDNSYILLGHQEIEAGWEYNLRRKGLIPILTKGDAYASAQLELQLFDSACEYYLDPDFIDPFLQEKGYNFSYNEIRDMAFDAQFADLYDFIYSIHRHSLLIEFTMSFAHDHIEVVPYHSHAIHEVETKNEIVIVGRPAIIAKTTGAVFSEEIAKFEYLINNPGTKERHIQRFLELHPQFLRGLNYENIYPQIVLERDEDGPLRPDFILEPFKDAFCDILDLKLPSQNLFVGRKDRATLASALHEVAAQLREYAAYFEQEKYRKMVYEKYGLRLYKPRLIAIVGRDMKQLAKAEFRRALTQYDNLQFMTFDELLRHTKRRMLI